MTEEEYNIFYSMGVYKFTQIKNPTAAQCLAFLRGYEKEINFSRLIDIPKKHREFCMTQLKLEGLL